MKNVKIVSNSPMGNYIIIFITTPDKQCAQKISLRLINDKLAACAQVNGPIESIYQWKGQLHHDKEWRIILKSKKDLFSQIEKTVVEMHPYDIPQIMATEISDGHESYLSWIDECIKSETE